MCLDKISSVKMWTPMNSSQSIFNPSYQLKLYQFFEEYGSVRIFSKNQLIWGGRDSRLTQIYYIKYGYVKVVTQDNLKEDSLYVIFGKGDLFSLNALASDSNINLRFIALNRVKVYSVPVALFENNIANNSQVAYGTFGYMLNNSVYYDNLVVNLRYNKVSERLIAGLLALAKRFGHRQENFLTLDKIFNHRLIAAQINTSRESVSRELDKLRCKDLIDTSSGYIILKDIDGLYAEINQLPPPEFQIINSQK